MNTPVVSDAVDAGEHARSGFRTCFGGEAQALFFSPGRVNLIGEHTDYNDGWVLPVAIQYGTCFAASTNTSDGVRIWSGHYGELAEVPISGLASARPRGHWQDYLAGVMTALFPLARQPEGVDVFIHSTLPAGAGLSSSASLTAGFASVLNHLWQCGQSREALAVVARRAENEFVGLACGILDPFSVLMSASGKALLLNCGNMSWEHVPFPSDRYSVVAVHSGVARRLAESGYNTRRGECEQALARIRQTRVLSSLSDLTLEDLQDVRKLVKDVVLFRRVRHVVSENHRVLAAAAALRNKDMKQFGHLLLESHASIRDDYEASCPELDLLVETSMTLPGVVGAKVTGAGFGGSIVAVVKTPAVDTFHAELARRYTARTGLQPGFHVCSPGPGVTGPDSFE